MVLTWTQLYQSPIQDETTSFASLCGQCILSLMMGSSYTSFLAILFSVFAFEVCSLANARDNITSGQILKDPQTLVSSTGTYALGFFTPPNSRSRYLGIWYNQVSVREYVWVANREKPINDSSGWLRISKDGNPQVLDGRNQTLWTSGVNKSTTPSMAKILDSGDFVLSDSTLSNITWQSSQHPADTFLPNLNFAITPNSRIIRSWKSPSDPSLGNFSIGTDTFIAPQIVVWNGDQKYYRTGPFNGNNFIGLNSEGVDIINAAVLLQGVQQGVITAVYADPTLEFLSSTKLNHEGAIIQPYWDVDKHSWLVAWQVPYTKCDIYATCGAFGSCNSLRNPICRCLRGFEPKNKEEWKNGRWSGGCARRAQLKCEGDGFLKLRSMKVPDYANSTAGLSEDGCRSQCLQNCSCLAYAHDSGIGCITWSQSLIDVQEFSAAGVDLYVRLASSELGSKAKKKAVLAISVCTSAVVAVAVVFFLWWCMVQRQGKRTTDGTKANINLEHVRIFEFKDLEAATNNFEESNKLGQGGFGPVYRGKLIDGREIAVKRLSEASGQGVEEFMNEVTVICKLHHRNLVRLLGCCIEGEDKMLIYEYMPNKSLDAFIFDPVKREALSWQVIFNIIEGICRGLLYLHRDSTLRIIHRDLKAGNVLLDGDLNPKISDFGMARIFCGNQDQDSTRRIVGTYGYMSPEYAMQGRISEKSDVYSFGVVLIEIITGTRNNNFWHDEDALSLLGYVWKLWNEGSVVLLINRKVSDPMLQPKIVGCLHVGLLCVQEFAADRPTFAMVMAMLSGEIVDLPMPKHPGFMLRHGSSDSGSTRQTNSTYNYSFTEMGGR